MNEKLYIRHEGAPNHPFVEIDQETLKVKADQVTYTGSNGLPMPLLWTKSEESGNPDSEEGTRFMQ